MEALKKANLLVTVANMLSSTKFTRHIDIYYAYRCMIDGNPGSWQVGSKRVKGSDGEDWFITNDDYLLQRAVRAKDSAIKTLIKEFEKSCNI